MTLYSSAGYPIWHSDLPMAMYTFMESYDFSDKTIIPFNTHEGSGQSGTVNSIRQTCSGAEVMDGFSVRGTTAQNDTETSKNTVKNWLETNDFKSLVNTEKPLYTTEDLHNLQDFLLAKETPDLKGKKYDLDGDGVWSVFDLCLMRREVLKTVDTDNSSKTLVAYYSASGTTEKIATYVAGSMNADTFIITPVQPYSDSDLDWTDQGSRVVTEHNDENRHTELVTVDVPDWDSYDNVFIGYPIWWHEASWVINDFVKENDFTGKNVIPFCTSISSPLGESDTLLAEMSGTGNWLDGMRFTSRSTQDEVKSWVTGLDLSNSNIFSIRAENNYPLD